MSGLSTCLRCGKTLIEEEKDSHVCTPVLKGVRYLDIDYMVQTKNERGETLYMVKGLDGYLYRLTQKKETHAFAELSTESKHRDDFDDTPTSPQNLVESLILARV
jgi:hypothetical protein